ncbi:MAG: hypothetical protein B7O98_00875 [Zestosphaera tikiterensis]|uniref:ABC transporter domain-containing protein n=1 Tax=Zestosphaera tikiterensis TaxID=1973259 RepID=A0A2R7Y8X7_9CREN|nr:MAG: hypothetical protein B7O98_00875 [Zestosphaera tikiterensis]
MKIKVLNVSFAYNSIPTLKNVSFEVSEGEVVYVVGPNGAGKTTLLKVVASMLKPKSGAVYIDGRDSRNYDARELAKVFAYANARVNDTLPTTVAEFLATGRYPHQKPLQIFESYEDLKFIEGVVKELNIEHLMSKKLSQLSSGELQRVIIARALIQQPKVLLLDEPSAFLDIRYRLEVLSYVNKVVKTRGLASLIAIHDLYLASTYADKAILMSNGEIIAAGKPEDVFREDLIESVYKVKVRIVDVNNRKVVLPIEVIY